MTAMQNRAIEFIRELSEEKLQSAMDYLKYLYEQDYPLDDFDYELAKRSDRDTDSETVSFSEVLREVGLTFDDLSN